MTTKISSANVDATITTPAGAQTLTNKTIGPTAEVVAITAAAPAATTNFDLATQAVQYYTSNAANNFTLNIRGNSTTTLDSYMAVGSSLSLALMITVGATGYYLTAFQIDGASVTPKWLNGTAPSAANGNTVVMYSLSILKTASATYTVLGTSIQFF